MNQKPLYQYIFDLLDYSEQITPLVVSDDIDSFNYFVSLVYIEDILDKYARSLVVQSANQAGQNSSELLNSATDRMAVLRSNLASLAKQYDYTERLQKRAEELTKNWPH